MKLDINFLSLHCKTVDVDVYTIHMLSERKKERKERKKEKKERKKDKHLRQWKNEK